MNTKNNNNLKTYVLWIILLFCISHTREKMLNKLTHYNKKEEQTGADLFENSIEISKACVAGMMAAIPPVFCWKAGADFGRIPFNCPHGYWRFLLMCYKNCEPPSFYFRSML
jgi:hypothetical protein